MVVFFLIFLPVFSARFFGLKVPNPLRNTGSFSEMEFLGLDVSDKNLKGVGGKLQKNNISLHDGLYKHKQVNKTDNVTSNEDQISILFTRLGGFELYPPVYTDKNKPSVSKECLDILLLQIEEELNSRKKK